MPLGDYNVLDVEKILLDTPSTPPFPPASDRDAWKNLCAEVGGEKVRETITDGEAAAAEEIPSLPATLYLNFQRTGVREPFQKPFSARRRMLADLVPAECVEYEGRFLDPIMDAIWALCEESSWANPAHQRTLTDLDHPIVDLTATGTALQLAEAVSLVGAELDPLVGKRVRDEIDRRIWTPYLTRHDFWWLHNSATKRVNNWTAVCNAGVVGSALYLEEDAARLAEIVARAARSLQDYLDTFGEDGGSSEGPGYWGYGFGNYTILAHLIEHRTQGKINFLQGDHIRAITSYPMRTVLSPGVYVNFSDCDAGIRYSRPLLAFLSQRLGLPQLGAFARQQASEGRRQDMVWSLRRLFWRLPDEDGKGFVPARHDWLGELMWMVARYDPKDPAALVLAVKAGHNAEQHNQNDVGSFIVHVNGESVIVDPGRGRYTASYFGPRRYEHFVNASLGHSVPVPNGTLQGTGREFKAERVEHTADDRKDTLCFEMKAAYPPESGLESLRRRVTLHRDPPRGWVELIDEARFAEDAACFESSLTTFADVEIHDRQAVLKGSRGALAIEFDPENVEARVDRHEAVEFASGPADIHRIVFSAKKAERNATVRLRVRPT